MVVVAWMSAGLVRWLKGDAGLFGFEQIEGHVPEDLRRDPRSPQDLHGKTGTRGPLRSLERIAEQMGVEVEELMR